MQNIIRITIFYIVLHRALQARVSRQVMMNVEEDHSDDEPKQPERVFLADLRRRGKKKAIAPINRVGSAIRSKHVNVQICCEILSFSTFSVIIKKVFNFDGFCEQVFLEACSHTAPLSSAMFQTVGWWSLTRTRLKAPALQSLSWSLGWPLPLPGQRRTSRIPKNGAMSRYETSRC